MDSTDVVQTRLSFRESIALGLNLYALFNSEYQVLLSDIAKKLKYNPNLSVEFDFVDEYSLLIPPSLFAAEKRTYWLINEIENTVLEEREVLVNILFAPKKREFVAPKNLLFGLRATWKYGPVAGDMIKDESLITQVIILHPNSTKWGKMKTVKAVQQSSIGIVAECLKKANYKFNRIEPELSEWLLGKNNIEVYQATNQLQFQEIQNTIGKAGLIHKNIIVDSEIEVLALIPAFSGSFSEITSELILVE